ncbi:hypothetical protein tloyanaT_12160 [Thalassotalea loyana]|uniref:Uncharacterized protein n=2 Tax=Thalassotalea loyana TaxID=280483 RepID=A0ABQ6HC03_9GAMM|nr:hypothetical protein tloyanaT_12160 [Thalassotalea loyana]
MQAVTSEYSNLVNSNHAESARRIAEQAIAQLAELTPNTISQCAALLAEQLNAVAPQPKHVTDYVLSHDELVCISELFQQAN